MAVKEAERNSNPSGGSRELWKEVYNVNRSAWKQLRLSIGVGIALVVLLLLSSAWSVLGADSLPAGTSGWRGITDSFGWRGLLGKGELLAIYGIFATLVFTAVVSDAFWLDTAKGPERILISERLNWAVQAMTVVAFVACAVFILSQYGYESSPEGSGLMQARRNLPVNLVIYWSVYTAIAAVGFTSSAAHFSSGRRQFFAGCKALERMGRVYPEALNSEMRSFLRDEGLAEEEGLGGGGEERRPPPGCSEWQVVSDHMRVAAPAADMARHRKALSVLSEVSCLDAFPFIMGILCILSAGLLAGDSGCFVEVIAWSLFGEGILYGAFLVMVAFQPALGIGLARISASVLIVVSAGVYWSVGVFIADVSAGVAVSFGFVVLIRLFQVKVRFSGPAQGLFRLPDLVSWWGAGLYTDLSANGFENLTMTSGEFWKQDVLSVSDVEGVRDSPSAVSQADQ